LVESGPEQIVFNRISDNQTLRCCFDFNDLNASFVEI
jgi:alpha-glucosidase